MLEQHLLSRLARFKIVIISRKTQQITEDKFNILNYIIQGTQIKPQPKLLERATRGLAQIILLTLIERQAVILDLKLVADICLNIVLNLNIYIPY